MLTQVSVIVPCFNSAATIRETLSSVFLQACDGLEVIAIDDGSTDETSEIISREFSTVRLIRTANRGPSAARSAGTDISRGRFIQYLDSDDLLPPGKLEIQVRALDRTRADVAYGDWQKAFWGPHGELRADAVVSRRIEGQTDVALMAGFWCPLHTYLFRRETVTKVGGWNLGLPVIQDVRFVLDCALLGANFIYTPGFTAQYRVHSGSVSTSDSVAFVRDCLRNAVEVQHWWMENGGIDADRRKALLKAYEYVARASYGRDCMTFDQAYAALEGLQPGYCPSRPRRLAIASRVFGYKWAESFASHYRTAKRLFRR